MKKFAIVLMCLVVWGCNEQTLIRVAVSDHPQRTARELLERRAHGYQSDPLLAVRDARAFAQLVESLRGHVRHTWGRRATVLPNRHRYVKYTQNYQSRAIVNFDSGEITVETLDRRHPERSLQNAIVTTLLTPDDPRAVDLYSARTVRLSGTPYLSALVRDQHGRPVRTPPQAEAYARWLRGHRRHTRRIRTGAGGRAVTFVRFRMVRDHVRQAARRYEPLVTRYAHRYGVSRNLVFAIIKTESNFNPFAVSPAPAYGLMQLVPTTGGRDAYRLVHGRDHTPSPQRLLRPDRNIELGTAYLSLVSRHYLGGVRNPVSREYCTIAAYNTGAGNVLRVFSSDRAQAVRTINRMTPAAVYRRLHTRLHSVQARRYLVKVLSARRDFVSL
jgi:membrane-bound lytic murein transglycosylase C